MIAVGCHQGWLQEQKFQHPLSRQRPILRRRSIWRGQRCESKGSQLWAVFCLRDNFVFHIRFSSLASPLFSPYFFPWDCWFLRVGAGKKSLGIFLLDNRLRESRFWSVVVFFNLKPPLASYHTSPFLPFLFILIFCRIGVTERFLEDLELLPGIEALDVFLLGFLWRWRHSRFQSQGIFNQNAFWFEFSKALSFNLAFLFLCWVLLAYWFPHIQF